MGELAEHEERLFFARRVVLKQRELATKRARLEKSRKERVETDATAAAVGTVASSDVGGGEVEEGGEKDQKKVAEEKERQMRATREAEIKRVAEERRLQKELEVHHRRPSF
jgi:hypothetical protein